MAIAVRSQSGILEKDTMEMVKCALDKLREHQQTSLGDKIDRDTTSDRCGLLDYSTIVSLGRGWLGSSQKLSLLQTSIIPGICRPIRGKSLVIIRMK